jgi:AraC family transcriptional regulator, regulatory protein of adaptative response / DNA-3-methyladenine glycosylase II
MKPKNSTIPDHIIPDHIGARAIGFNDNAILGSMTSGIYCLQSCETLRRSKNGRRLFTSESAAKSVGLSGCKICRPDRFLKNSDENLTLFQSLIDEATAAPARFVNASALVKASSISSVSLSDVFRDHAHLTPAQWLQKVRVRHVATKLIQETNSIANIAQSAGFQNEVIFAKQFFDQMRMTPSEYRALDASKPFFLQLPQGYRPNEILAYQARDPASLSERSVGNRIWKALITPDGPVVLELTLDTKIVSVRIHAKRKIKRESVAKLHADALYILGLINDVDAFERQNAAFVKLRRGLHLPLLPSGFDALCWAIIGQQINIRFASSLRIDMIALAGKPIGDMRTHPTPQAVADIDAAALLARRFSRSKVKYLISAAHAVASGKLKIERLTEGSAIAAEKALTSQNGIGTWTARYVLMRSGFADAAPVGDSGLATALQHLHKLPERPDAQHTAQLMSRFSPHRSLASMHLWTYMKENI